MRCACIFWCGAAPDLCADGVFVFQQPAILFFLRFEKAEQRFLCAGGTSFFVNFQAKTRLVRQHSTKWNIL
jgi:hypothetical protein